MARVRSSPTHTLAKTRARTPGPSICPLLLIRFTYVLTVATDPQSLLRLVYRRELHAHPPSKSGPVPGRVLASWSWRPRKYKYIFTKSMRSANRPQRPPAMHVQSKMCEKQCNSNKGTWKSCCSIAHLELLFQIQTPWSYNYCQYIIMLPNSSFSLPNELTHTQFQGGTAWLQAWIIIIDT